MKRGLIKWFGGTACSFLAVGAMLIPAPKAHARDATAAIVATGIAGAILGAGLQKAGDRHHHCQPKQGNPPPTPSYRGCGSSRGGQCGATQYQKNLMKQVMNDYDSAYHHRFVEYVTIDLSGHLTPHQQSQLIDLMNQRHTYVMPYPSSYR